MLYMTEVESVSRQMTGGRAVVGHRQHFHLRQPVPFLLYDFAKYLFEGEGEGEGEIFSLQKFFFDSRARINMKLFYENMKGF